MTTREILLERMQSLASRGIDCNACRGTCCTFEANSMQIPPEEADVIARHLLETPETLNSWREKLEEAIRRFGLARPEVGDGRRALARRRYTCPFHLDPGCALPVTVKPLGCLAFNPRAPGLSDGGDCRTDGVAAADSATRHRPIPQAVLAALS